MAEIDRLFKLLVDHKGSDLHLSPGRKPMIRVNGDMTSLDGPIQEEVGIRRLVQEIMPERIRREFDETSDVDFGYEIPGTVRIRANVFRERLGIAGVFRAVPATIMTPEQLGLPRSVTDLCYLSKGLVLVTGPTGSGKSTTLASLTDLINRTRTAHIITIEDPIEFVHADKKCLVTQREVYSHTAGFAQALRAALREDPDVVLVGEMRDLETIETAITMAETGHLVFATLHTSTAPGTIDRIVDSFPAERQNQIRAMLADSLRASISQRLCKKRGGGRVAAFEVMLVNRAVSSLIREAKVHQIPSAMQTSKVQGMLLLNDSLMKLVKDGVVEPNEAYTKSVDRKGLVALFEENGVRVPDLQQDVQQGTEWLDERAG